MSERRMRDFGKIEDRFRLGASILFKFEIFYPLVAFTAAPRSVSLMAAVFIALVNQIVEAKYSKLRNFTTAFKLVVSSALVNIGFLGLAVVYGVGFDVLR